MGRISLIDKKLDLQNNCRNIVFFDVNFENWLILTYLLWFSTQVQMKKNCGDTPCASLSIKVVNIIEDK